MKRREFIMLLGGVAAGCPFIAQAQQPAMPVVGLLYSSSSGTTADVQRAFRAGLKETGFIENENLTILDRWADNKIERIPELAAELIRRQVAVLTTSGNDAALAVKAATSTIPIVFLVGEDPTRLGLVASLARPGGNATGVNFLVGELVPKRLELLRDLVPGLGHVAVLVNPASATTTELTLRDLQSAEHAIGLQIEVLNADTSDEIELAFAGIARLRPGALFVGPGPFFTNRRVQLTQLAARHAIPASYGVREFPEVGGLMSYGASLAEAHRQIGIYTGRILKGAKPADLPVMQSSKYELVINQPTARMLGLTVPPSLLAIADEVIE